MPRSFRALGAGLVICAALLAPAPLAAAPSGPDDTGSFAASCRGAGGQRGARVVCADLVALDQMLVYNRFGSFNPFGMIFALRRDVVPMAEDAAETPDCALDTATAAGAVGPLAPGQVRLRDCHRPRPLVLRANVGDLLFLRVTNLLAPATGGDPHPRDLSRDFCAHGPTDDAGRAAVADAVSRGAAALVESGEALCADPPAPPEPAAEAALHAPDWPRTRSLNLAAEGLMPLALPGQSAPHPACFGLDAVAPGQEFSCLYEVVQEGTHFFASRAAPAGGEGDGGSITHGLFGAVLAERPGTRWYRSQVSAAALDRAWAPKDAPRHARQGRLDYEAAIDGMPVLNMARALDGGDFAAARAVELVHADLNAVIWCDAAAPAAQAAQPLGCAAPDGGDDDPSAEPRYGAFREFTVFFHDELKSYYTRNFEELARFGQLAGVRDGFAINYGASGMGTLLLANRKGIGPAAACAECLYEEFFLTSWANGDPALLEWFADDPSNVHHSYLNDPVVFRNFHAGPKETHVFHLHAHQWFAGNDPGRGSYLDSQTVGPGQGFTYNIYHGGRRDGQGHWYVGGSGNRNRTVGDSIFHCHLYPHFAQGMWALWRVHDVFEDGTRKLPDGQAQPGLSVDIRAPEEAQFKRLGSVDPESGRWLGTDDPATPGVIEGAGTPVPALLPLPGEALPPLPTYADEPQATPPKQAGGRPAAALPRRGAALGAQAPAGTGPERLIRAQATTVPAKPAPAEPAPAEPAPAVPEIDAMPGYPFYIAGAAGHRPPQAPRDIARALDAQGRPTADLLSGGLGRHVVLQAERSLGAAPPPELATRDSALAAALDQGDNRRQLEALRSRIVAKALALGDMTGHLEKAVIRPLDPEGTLLERAAQRFHHDGAGLTVIAPDGSAAAIATGAYATPQAPRPGVPDTPPGRFEVNGAPPAPGAPFADPCGGAPGREGAADANDPLTGATGYVIDPRLTGFRRYEVSAVQLDLVVNQAGWHDPQARIDVLTPEAAALKDDGSAASRARISPALRDDAEPFFFRALSGECIEFRHTNELPKDLELDDFQVRTPTDTIGQHIHLVKFDVTSSDGSGNGWNYEDGTFAADELMARRCASLESARPLADRPDWGVRAADAALCKAARDKADPLSRIWRLPLDGTSRVEGREIANRTLFQTTVQRWFADPVLTRDGLGADQDRTLRTVFSHDHFGPSSIQQHGFYTALLIEPNPARICDPRGDACTETAGHQPGAPFAAQDADAGWVGSHKRVLAGGSHDAYHPDYREYALAVADFALLYTPRDREDAAAVEPVEGAERSGMARLHCEAKLATSGRADRMEAECGAPNALEPDVPPAWWAARGPGELLTAAETQALRAHLVGYRSRAASPDGKPVAGPALAKPVAPPSRPESISVDHHDPYVVNYRNAPLPLRLATSRADGSPSPDCAPLAMTFAGTRAGRPSPVVAKLAAGEMPLCSYRYQLKGAEGDAGRVLSSWPAGARDHPARDPETPQFEAYQNERLLFRLVQGAQEVQHVFNVAGLAGPRNIDQRYPQRMRDLAVTVPPARRACFEAVRAARPELYEAWLDMTPAALDSAPPEPDEADHAAAFEKALANCDNLEGYTFAQEIGISEHFELRSRLRADVGVMEFGRPAPPPATAGGGKDVSDYLYNFGTQDALWNGAWGLLRVYGDRPSRDAVLAGWQAARPPGEAAPDPRALVPLNARPGAGESAAATEAPPAPMAEAPGCPLPIGPGAGGHQTAGVIVALRTGDVWRGTDYGGHRSDPDGLMLALLSPLDLPRAGKPRDFRLDADWQDLGRSAVLAAVARAYARPEPFVMRVNAGDCVSLRYVNALAEPSPGAGLPDGLGDAQMPRIVPLNTDPAQAVTRISRPGATRVEGVLTATTAPVTGLRPSAALGLSIGLPGGDLIRNLPLGYGINAEPMPAGLLAQDRVAVSTLFRFYAGRMRIALPDPGQTNIDPTHFVAQRVANAVAPDRALKPRETEPQADFTVLGRDFVLVPGADDALRRRLQARTTVELQNHVHWIPYAFGPVPVRVTGDVISQPTHGLFGVIDVLPRDWPLPQALAPAMPAPPSEAEALDELRTAGGLGDGAATPWRAAAPPRGFGAPALFADVPMAPDPQPGAPGTRVREFVLFYQDGLNHLDAKSKILWRLEDDGSAEIRAAVRAAGSVPRIAPDCLICDDSYDLGDQGVSYRSRPFASLMRYADIAGRGRVEASDDLNALVFPDRFLPGDSHKGQPQTDPDLQPLTLLACPGEQVLMRVVHPGGRARQHSFVMNGLGYDDLFPGFGFPNSALVTPGKAISAWLHPPQVLGPDGSRQDVRGTVLWHDGPNFLMAGGIWGLLSFRDGPHCRAPGQ
ncbi:cupredoxin domain-containing protein [Paracoccus aminovorans]|nr:hypothetical protein [Paracoccus aminovorans]